MLPSPSPSVWSTDVVSTLCSTLSTSRNRSSTYSTQLTFPYRFQANESRSPARIGASAPPSRTRASQNHLVVPTRSDGVGKQ